MGGRMGVIGCEQELAPALRVDQRRHDAKAVAGVDVWPFRSVLIGVGVSPGERVHLKVGDRLLVTSLDECTGLEHRASKPTISKQVLLDHAAQEVQWRSAVKARGSAVHERKEQVIVQVLADTGKVMVHVDSVLTKVVRRPHARQHQDLGRPDGPS